VNDLSLRKVYENIIKTYLKPSNRNYPKKNATIFEMRAKGMTLAKIGQEAAGGMTRQGALNGLNYFYEVTSGKANQKMHSQIENAAAQIASSSVIFEPASYYEHGIILVTIGMYKEKEHPLYKAFSHPLFQASTKGGFLYINKAKENKVLKRLSDLGLAKVCRKHGGIHDLVATGMKDDYAYIKRYLYPNYKVICDDNHIVIGNVLFMEKSHIKLSLHKALSVCNQITVKEFELALKGNRINDSYYLTYSMAVFKKYMAWLASKSDALILDEGSLLLSMKGKSPKCRLNIAEKAIIKILKKSDDGKASRAVIIRKCKKKNVPESTVIMTLMRSILFQKVNKEKFRSPYKIIGEG